MLTNLQTDAFNLQGFLALPGFLPAAMLHQLQHSFDQLIRQTDQPDRQFVVENKQGRFVTNLENPCQSPDGACLALLGYPPLLELARQLCGDDFFLIQDFAVIKNQGDEMPVHWHQDMLHERSGRCFTMGIYLDEAHAGDGAIRVVPGSHLMSATICEMSQMPFIEIPMQAGDILVHDMMLAHCSEPMRHHQIRRVIYFIFLSASHVAREKIYPEEVVRRRYRLQELAKRTYQVLHPEEKPFQADRLFVFPEDEERTAGEILEEVYRYPVQARPSAYCLPGIT